MYRQIQGKRERTLKEKKLKDARKKGTKDINRSVNALEKRKVKIRLKWVLNKVTVGSTMYRYMRRHVYEDFCKVRSG